jgi:deoxycytidine triphosphate deaminase
VEDYRLKRNATYIMKKIKDPEGLAKPAQIGVDITLQKAHDMIVGDYGIIPPDDAISTATKKAGSLPMEWIDELGTNRRFLEFNPGAYLIIFDQGIKLENDECAFIMQRSSLNRNACFIAGSVYDPGFETEYLGATLYVFNKIRIYEHARIAQLLIEMSESTDNPYNGQWQGKAN